METTLGETFVDIFIPLSAALGIAFALYQWGVVSRVKITAPLSVYGLEDGQADNVDQQIAEIQYAISTGATSFLTTEYKYLAAFMAFFSVLVFLFLGSVNSFSTSWQPCPDNPSQLCAPSLANAFFTTVAFILGALTSTLSGYLGMKIATSLHLSSHFTAHSFPPFPNARPPPADANARTTVEARRGIGPAFVVAFRSGAVMGFLLAANGLIVLFITIVLFRLYYGNDWASLFETITGYGLGGSSVALFGRVGGGIYTKAADVGADLVGKVERNIPEDDPRNPAVIAHNVIADNVGDNVIADNVGDNVGDIAGMGSDLFGSFAESTCAALVIASISSLGQTHNFTAMCFPLLVSALGILVCLFTTLFATDWFHVTEARHVEPQLKAQLLISTVLMTPLVLGLCYLALPSSFTIVVAGEEADKTVQNWQIFFCVASGLWGGLLIGYVTEYFTSHAYSPVRDVADSCRTGAATNIIFGLALGYKSVIIPVFAIAVAIYISYAIAAMYGVALAALGMLSTLATGLAIDAYGPISDNAGGIAEMAGLGADVRERTDALDSAGNTTAAIGKGFAIGSAALVSLALFGAYVSRAEVTNILITNPQTFVGLLVGAMLPYWFSAMTMKSVGKAALAMVDEVRRQFDTIPGLMEGTARPDYRKCVQISTKASLNEMLPPGALVLLAPIITGVLFGTATLAGLLAGALVSGVQMAVSASNTGGAWDNAKKYIEAGMTEHAQSLGPKGSEAHKAAVIGDTVGDPLKDTSGPSLNILIKLMAVESLVLAPFFVAHAVIGDTVGDLLKDTSGPSLNILIKLMAVESLVLAPFFVAHGGLIWGKSK
ncbi:unnamed protein product [Closterium sp. NIES-64]|nr:unnamed protein product [Closterium sp. NIES-64]